MSKPTLLMSARQAMTEMALEYRDAQARPAEPVAFEFQHEDTGLIDFVDPQQVEWGFQKNNPRWQMVGPVYRHPPAEPKAEPDAWCPDVCPITGAPFFMWIQHHETGQFVPTYGGPYNSYTIPVRQEDGSFCRERYDHDEDGWILDELQDVGVQIVDDQAFVYAEPCPPAEVVRLPVSVDEAEAMQKIGFAYLQEHAPERLTRHAQVIECLLFALRQIEEKSTDEKSKRMAWDALTTWKEAGE